MNNVEQFLQELSALTRKYKIEIGGCGCCDSPYLTDLLENEQAESWGYKYPDGYKMYWCDNTGESK